MLNADRQFNDPDSLQGLRTLQRGILEAMARGRSLAQVMKDLCLQAEALAPGLICSVIAVDEEGRLRPVAAPSLPDYYSAAIDGVPIGPKCGSCGTAAFLGDSVEVVDISTDPLWEGFRELAEPLGLRACWSTPIHGSNGKVIGTFAFYYRTCRGARAIERIIVATCVHLCAIALEQEEARKRIHRLAFSDALTGLPNRASFMRKAGEALANGGEAALHFVDVDGFKGVNDSLGHEAGDALLVAVAERMSACLSSKEMAARLGGDEFVVLQPGAGPEKIAELAGRLVAAFETPFRIGGRTVSIGVSVGAARAPHDAADLGALMKRADVALYCAKKDGRGQYRIFDRDLAGILAARQTLERELRDAAARREFEVFYQPMMDLAAGRVTGVEALVRWRRPGGGFAPPAEFIQLAEETGLIVEIGDQVLSEACARAVSFPPGVRIAVNVSPVQLCNPGFALRVARTLVNLNLSPNRLELEITESVPLADGAATLACVRDLHDFGVSIALDDFGTGYSALAHLRAFPVDRIKVDRSLVCDLGQKPESASIVRAIIGLAHDLGLQTTAEGIETPSQLRQVRALGCIEGQGYLFSKPMPIAGLEAFFGKARGGGMSNAARS